MVLIESITYYLNSPSIHSNLVAMNSSSVWKYINVLINPTCCNCSMALALSITGCFKVGSVKRIGVLKLNSVLSPIPLKELPVLSTKTFFRLIRNNLFRTQIRGQINLMFLSHSQSQPFGKLMSKGENSSDPIFIVPDSQFTALLKVRMISLSIGTLVLSSLGLVEIKIGLLSSSFASIV